jgi:integrase
MNLQGARASKRGRGEGGLILVGGVWYMLWRRHGRQFRKSSGETVKARAAIKLAEKLKELREGAPLTTDPNKLHYADLRALYMRDYSDQQNKSLLTNVETGEQYVCGLKHVDEFFDGWRVSEITVDVVNKFKAARQEAGAANGTINRSLAALRRMFTLATEQGNVKFTPAIKFLYESKKTSARQGFLEVADYEKLSNALPEYVRPILATGFYTGMRLGEILGLKWFQVNLAENRITLEGEDTKNAEARVVPLIDGLPQMLEDIRRKNPDAERVFLSDNGKPVASFIKAWRSACVKAAIRTKLNGKEVVSHFSKGAECCPYCVAEQVDQGTYIGFLFHDLRRSAVRNLTQAGVPRSLAMRISGHKTESVFERYNISTQSDLQDAGAAVEVYLAKKRAESKKAPSPMKKRLAIAQ